MNAPMDGQIPLPLFGDPGPAPAPAPVPASAPGGKPEWKRLGSRRRPRCTVCLAMQAARTLKHMAESARWQRTTPESVLLLCAEHADAIKATDEKEGH